MVECGVYKHYKGGRVRVIGVSRHSETLELYVVYITLYNNRTDGIGSMWNRPLSMFTEDVVVDGNNVPRFKRME